MFLSKVISTKNQYGDNKFNSLLIRPINIVQNQLHHSEKILIKNEKF